MTYRIYGTQCAPKTHDTSILLDTVYNNFEEADDQCQWLNKCTDLYQYTVVPEATVHMARQEAECWFGEVGEYDPTDEMMDIKHMEFIESLIALSALATLGNTVYAADF